MVPPASSACASLVLGRFPVKLTLREIFVKVKARHGITLSLMPKVLGFFRPALGEHLEARFHQHKIFNFARRRPGIEDQWIFAAPSPFRVIPIKQPLSGV